MKADRAVKQNNNNNNFFRLGSSRHVFMQKSWSNWDIIMAKRDWQAGILPLNYEDIIGCNTKVMRKKRPHGESNPGLQRNVFRIAFAKRRLAFWNFVCARFGDSLKTSSSCCKKPKLRCCFNSNIPVGIIVPLDLLRRDLKCDFAFWIFSHQASVKTKIHIIFGIKSVVR